MRTRVELMAKYRGGVQIRGDFQSVVATDSAKFYGKSSFELNRLSRGDVEFLRRLKAGVSGDSLQGLSSERAWKFIAVLDARGALKYLPEGGEEGSVGRQVEWLSYFHPAPMATQRKIESKKVMIVGCGGTGAIIATHLARTGINRLVLIDPGVVDAPDLNRQLSYFPQDLGLKKVDALAAELRRLRASVEVKGIPHAVESAAGLADLIREECPDLIINCADKPLGLVHAWVAEASREKKVPALFGGVGLGDASVGPLLIDDLSKQAYAAAMTGAHAAFNDGEQPLKASLCFTNSWASVMIAFEAFKYLTGIGEIKTLNRSLAVDFFEQSTMVETEWPGRDVVCK